MSKRHNRKFRISRRLGASLWGSVKDPVNNNKNYPPGVHGSMGYRKLSDYGEQLKAKQKLRKYYGDITESQFRGIYAEAVRRKGDTGQNLVGLLESRLDAFIYRMGVVPTIFAARQFVNHKHVMVNGKVVNIASYRLKVGDVVEVRECSKNLLIIQSALQSVGSVPDYIEFDQSKLSGRYVRIPVLEEIPYALQMEPHLVIEFYSR